MCDKCCVYYCAIIALNSFQVARFKRATPMGIVRFVTAPGFEIAQQTDNFNRKKIWKERKMSSSPKLTAELIAR